MSAPTASACRTSPDLTSAAARNIPSLPALQANSRSAQCTAGTAPIASASTVPDGFTAYGCDSEPTYTASIVCGSIPARASARRDAVTAIVMVSSSRAGTDFSCSSRPRSYDSASAPHTLAISGSLIRRRGTYEP